MSVEEKSIPHINSRIKHGEAVVFTEMEFMEEIKKGYRLKPSDIDVVTTSCQATTSGTSAMLCVPVAERGVFTRAKKIWLNGILGFPGPAPNERLGLVDTLIFADQTAKDNQDNYNGAKLIWDIIRRKEIQIECLSVEGDTYETSFTLDQVAFARMYVYNCFFKKLCAKSEGSSKTSHLKTIRAGTKILLNKAKGIVIGCGTRSAPERRSLSLAADMFAMAPEDIKEYETATGIAITNSLAIAIPVVSEEVLKDLADCIMKERTQKSQAGAQDLEEATALYLKELIKSGEFLLISSDMNLNNWFNG